MSKHSRKGFKKLENHELSEFTTLRGEESGSDSEIIELERENVSRKGGGACCWYVVLYLLLLSCVVVLMAMVGVYYGYNMMQLCNDYNHRIRSLEDKVEALENDLAAAKTTSNTELDTVSQRVSGVNESVIRLDSSLASHSGEVQETLDGMEKSLGDVRDRVAAFESHPPTIGEDEVGDMRSSMAEFRSHLESYDAQLADAKRDVGDATLKVTKTEVKVQVLQGNVTSLRRGLGHVEQDHRETADSLDLLTMQFTALQAVVQSVNETLLHEMNFTRDTFNETGEGLEAVRERLGVVSDTLDSLGDDVQSLNASLHQMTAETQSTPTLPTVPVTDATTETTASPAATTIALITTTPTTPNATTQSTTVASEPTTETVLPQTTEPSDTEPAATTTTEPETEPTVATTALPTEPTTPPATQNTVTTEPTVATTALPTEPTTPPATQDTVTTEPTDAHTNTSREPTKMEQSTEQSVTESVNTTSTGVPVGGNTQPPNPPPPPGTQPASDSTEATEDVPNSNPLLSSGEEEAPQIEGTPEEQPPTVDDGQKPPLDTASKLNILLEHFDSLDSDDNDALDYREFTVYSGDTPSAQAIFRLMDSDTDQSISYQEILNTIQMMEVQTTEGTGNDTYNEGDVPSTQPQPEIVATSTTPATQVTQEISSEDDVKNEREALDTLTALLEQFDSVDINGDSHLSNIEFSLFFPENNPMVANIFTFLDVNGDFFVSYDEVLDAINKLKQKVATEETTPKPEEELAELLNAHNS